MIDISFEEMLELARQAELQKRVEAELQPAPSKTFPDFCVIETLRPVIDNQGHEIPAGAQGTVLDPVANGAAYIVEFTDLAYQNNERWGLADLKPDEMRVVWVPGDTVPLPEDLRGKVEMPRRGRPPKPVAKRRRHNQTFRCNDDMLNRLQDAADANQRSISEEVERRLEASFRDADVAQATADTVVKALAQHGLIVAKKEGWNDPSADTPKPGNRG